MARKAVRPEDVLADGEDFDTLQGIRVRKGTIGAAMRNMELLESGSNDEKSAARAMIEELAPGLVVLGVHRHFQCRNAEVEAILARAAQYIGIAGRKT